MNYFLHSTKKIFFGANSEYHSKYLTSTCPVDGSLSLLIDAKSCYVSRERWNVFLLRDAESQDGAHARLLVEGVRGFGQRFITQYDFRPVGSSFLGLGTIKGCVTSREFSPERLFKNIKAYHFQAYSVTRLTAKRLIRFILADQEKDLNYNKKGTGNVSKCSMGQTYNCFTWAIAKLVEAEIIERRQLPILIPYPPCHINGQHAQDRRLLTQPASSGMC